MKRFLMFLVLLFVFLGLLISFYFKSINAQETTFLNETEIARKLDKILENQDEILQKLEDLKKEVKARCSH